MLTATPLYRSNLAALAAFQPKVAEIVDAAEIPPEVTPVTGRDGSLGCPQPGMVYAQVITPGYWIVLEVNDQKYPYHTDRKDQIILCIGPDKETDTQPTILPVIPIKPGEIQDGIPWMPVD